MIVTANFGVKQDQITNNCHFMFKVILLKKYYTSNVMHFHTVLQVMHYVKPCLLTASGQILDIRITTILAKVLDFDLVCACPSVILSAQRSAVRVTNWSLQVVTKLTYLFFPVLPSCLPQLPSISLSLLLSRSSSARQCYRPGNPHSTSLMQFWSSTSAWKRPRNAPLALLFHDA